MGCELLRRVLGVAKRADLEGIEDVATKLAASKLVIAIGEKVIMSGSGGPGDGAGIGND